MSIPCVADHEAILRRFNLEKAAIAYVKALEEKLRKQPSIGSPISIPIQLGRPD
jgi:hypothetical protein